MLDLIDGELAMLHPTTPHMRASVALKTSFIADALAMPVHWFYQPLDIIRAFDGGIQRFEAAPAFHPSSIMSLHAKNSGGRQSATKNGTGDNTPARQIVGEVILKGKAQFWDKANVHYHQGMKAGENTLNAHCARVLMRTLAASQGRYDANAFVEAYIDFMTMSPAAHPDTYAESYHRGFFANWVKGRNPLACAMLTHDTASIGGLVTLAPLVFAERLRGTRVEDIKHLCRVHLALTHPDEALMRVADHYVQLLCALLAGPDQQEVKALLIAASKGVSGCDLGALLQRNLPDHQVIGQVFSRACYIRDAWPIVLYLAYKYQDDPWQALLVNTHAGGDNVHRGMILATLLGLQSDLVAHRWFEHLVDHKIIAQEIDALVIQADAPK